MMNLPLDILATAAKESPALLNYIIKEASNDDKPEYFSTYIGEKTRSWSLFENEIIDIFKRKGKVHAIKHVLEESRRNKPFYLYFEQKYFHHPKKDFTVPDKACFTLAFCKFIMEDICY